MIKKLEGKRVYLRELLESDASVRYCKWLNDPVVNKYLETHSSTISELKSYIRARRSNPQCLFLGIFDKKNYKHIGNVKLEPIDFIKRVATLGILIGDKDYWGSGYGSEAINVLVQWSFDALHLDEVRLGVVAENIAAIKSYKKCGFKISGRGKIKRNGKYQDEILMRIKNKKNTAFRVSIIIRAYNCEDSFKRCIESARSQIFPKNRFEIIVINDGSFDKTWEEMEKYKKEKNVYLFDQNNRGPIKSANIGFLISCAKYVTLLDCDDTLEKDFLNKMTRAMDKKRADFAYSDYFERTNQRVAKVSPQNIFETIACGVLFSRKSLIESGLYTEDVGFAEYDLLLRNQKRWKSTYVSEILYTYNRHSKSLTSNKNSTNNWIKQLKKLHPQKLGQIRLIRPYNPNQTRIGNFLSLRRAEKEDWKFFLSLRNLPSVRKWSFNSDQIEQESHKNWFFKKIKSDGSMLFVLEKDSVKMGQARIDAVGAVGEIDVAVLPQYQGKGYGRFAIDVACKEAFYKFTRIKKIVAYIKVKNKASQSSFSNAGFENKGPVFYKGFRCLKYELVRF